MAVDTQTAPAAAPVKPAAAVPEACIKGLQLVLQTGGKLPDPCVFNNVSYRRKDVLAAVAKEAEKNGEPPLLASSPGTPPRPAAGGGSSADGTGMDESPVRFVCKVIQGDRKTRHCMFRLAGIIVGDDIRPAFMDSRLSASRQELDTSKTGAKRQVWVDICNRFTNKYFKASFKNSIG